MSYFELKRSVEPINNFCALSKFLYILKIRYTYLLHLEFMAKEYIYALALEEVEATH